MSKQEILRLKRKIYTLERQNFDKKKKKSLSKHFDPSLFVAGIAHEFNNILGAALGYAEWALETKKTEHMIESLEMVKVACERSAFITRSLQGLAQPREDIKAFVKVDKILLEVTKLLKTKFIEKEVSFEIVCSAKIKSKTIFTDETRVIEILLNLIKNSIEAFHSNITDKKITLNVSIKSKKIVFSVKDNAGGVPEIYRNMIFTPFFTTKGSLSSIHSEEKNFDKKDIKLGRGLGLFLSQTFAQQLAGDLILKPSKKQDKGSELLFFLPL